MKKIATLNRSRKMTEAAYAFAKGGTVYTIFLESYAGFERRAFSVKFDTMVEPNTGKNMLDFTASVFNCMSYNYKVREAFSESFLRDVAIAFYTATLPE